MLNNDQLEEWNKYPSSGRTEGPKKYEFKIKGHIIIKMAKFKDKENSKKQEEKKSCTRERTSIRLSNNLSVETL